VFLTGSEWFSLFRDALGYRELIESRESLVHGAGILENGIAIPAVIARHPQGKNEGRYVEEVVAAFKQINT
jgi:hypothetical protein